MQRDEFLTRQIKALLLSGGKCDESEANAAVTHALDYHRIYPNAGIQALIDKAKFYLKHNRRPAAPPRAEPVKKAAPPKRRQFS